jgi:hypothetical protein
MAYAGAGKNSRGTQLILAFKDNEYLGGGSPWEVDNISVVIVVHISNIIHFRDDTFLDKID